MLPRWSNGSAEMRFRPADTSPHWLELELVQPEPMGSPRPVPAVMLELDSQPVPLTRWRIQRPEAGHYSIHLDLPDLGTDEHRLRLTSPTFVPAELHRTSTDHRQLGVQLLSARLSSEGGVFTWSTVPVVPPLPVSAAERWSRAAFGWFYDPAVPHLVDVWPWYVSQSGMPTWLGLLVLVPVTLTIASGWLLARRLKRCAAGTVAVQIALPLLAAGALVATVLALVASLAGVVVAGDRALPASPPPGQIIGCSERCAMVANAYRDVLHREPDVDGWLAYYSSGLDDEGLRAALCRSEEGQRSGCVPSDSDPKTPE